MERKKKKGKGKGRGRGKGKGKGKGKGRLLGRGRGRGQMLSDVPDVPVSENSAARAVRRRLSFNDGEPEGSEAEEALQESASGDNQKKEDDCELAETQGHSPEVDDCPGDEMNVDETGDDADLDLQQVPAGQPDEHHHTGDEDKSEPAEVEEHHPVAAENLELASQPVPEEAHADDAAQPAVAGPEKASSSRGPNVNRTPDDLSLITPPCCSIHLNCILAYLSVFCRYVLAAFLTQIGL